MYVLRKRNGLWFVRQADNGAGTGGGPAAAPTGEAGDGQQQPQRNGDAPPASWDEVFQHDRFKQLIKRAKEAETALERAAKDQAAAEEAKLKEEQRFRELYEKAEARAATLDGELTAARQAHMDDRKRAALLEMARRNEPPFADQALADVTLFVDLGTLEIGEDGTVKGAEAAIRDLAKARPYMLQQQRQDPGSPEGRKQAGGQKPTGTGKPMGL